MYISSELIGFGISQLGDRDDNIIALGTGGQACGFSVEGDAGSGGWKRGGLGVLDRDVGPGRQVKDG